MNGRITKQVVWVIMSKDRELIAKGTPRNRYLVEVGNVTDKKRQMTYSSEGKAKAAFDNRTFFYRGHNLKKNYKAVDLEPVKVILEMRYYGVA